MAVNLIRNARVFVLTGAAAAVANAAAYAGGTYVGIDAADTYEVQVLNGITFSQTTNTQTITLNEAGPTPTRGQRAFNTALNPGDFSFTTYIRPEVTGGLVNSAEKVLWNALMSASVMPTAITGTIAGTGAVAAATVTNGIEITITGTTLQVLTTGALTTVTGFTGASLTAGYNGVCTVVSSNATTLVLRYLNKPSSVIATPTYSSIKVYNGVGWAPGTGVTGTTTSCTVVTTAGSDVHQLQNIALLIVADTEAYILKNSAMDQAVIDFGVDAISSIQWTGKSTQIVATSVTPALATLGTNVTTGTSTALGYTSVNTAANFIQNKLSTVTLVSNIGGVAGTSYTVPLTGGSITIANNLNYKTPENLGVVNIPIGYTTGTRAISGTLNAYLRTGNAGDTGSLYDALVASASTSAETAFRLQVEIGGITNGNRVEVETDGAMLSIPTIDAQDVISTAIAFTAQGSAQNQATAGYDLTVGNELAVRYFSI